MKPRVRSKAPAAESTTESEIFTLISDTTMSMMTKAMAPTAILARIGLVDIGHGEIEQGLLLDGEIGGEGGSAPGDQRQDFAGEAAHQSQEPGDQHDADKDEVKQLEGHRLFPVRSG